MQLYFAFDSEEFDTALYKVQCCIEDIHSWMCDNKLLLNSNKTEILLLGRKTSVTKVPSSASLYGMDIHSNNSVRSLGVLLDSQLRMEAQVNSLCKSAYFHLRNIGRIRQHLNCAPLETLVHALVASRMDYCNSLLSGYPKAVINKLQHLQNSAARLITLTNKREHITPVLIDLHWLPVTFRIQFKLLLLVFKALHGTAPDYLSELLIPRSCSRTTRSSTSLLLVQPRTKLVSCGDRAFSTLGPKLWNSLPANLQNTDSLTVFKSHLKTHSFQLTYP